MVRCYFSPIQSLLLAEEPKKGWRTAWRNWQGQWQLGALTPKTVGKDKKRRILRFSIFASLRSRADASDRRKTAVSCAFITKQKAEQRRQTPHSSGNALTACKNPKYCYQAWFCIRSRTSGAADKNQQCRYWMKFRIRDRTAAAAFGSLQAGENGRNDRERTRKYKQNK